MLSISRFFPYILFIGESVPTGGAQDRYSALTSLPFTAEALLCPDIFYGYSCEETS
jgi:hypothetical protein